MNAGNLNFDADQSVHDFRRDGFVVFRSLLEDSLMSRIQQTINQLIETGLDALPREHVFYEDRSFPSTLKQIQKLNVHVPFFGELMNQGVFPELASCLLCDEVAPQNLQYFNKPPRHSKPTPPHQDGYYFKINPCEAVTMWLSLDSVDQENGCVRYVRGSHQDGMQDHQRTKTLGFSQGISDYGKDGEDQAEVAINAQPGDLLVHHALTIHRADANRSAQRHRRSLGFVYFAKRAKIDQVAVEAYQEKLARDLRSQGRL